MNKVGQDMAEVLVAAWVLSGHRKDAIPVSRGIFDRALQLAMHEGAFPETWRKLLHFVDARAGLMCVELEEILDAAQRATIVEPNASYLILHVNILPQTARLLLRRQGISESDAASWGMLLRRGLEASHS